MTALSLSLSVSPMYDPTGSNRFHSGRHSLYFDSPRHQQHSSQESELCTPLSATTTGGSYFADTPLESPMEEMEQEWEPEPEMCPLPLITPPSLNLTGFQFPPQQTQSRGRHGVERARSRSVNHPQPNFHPTLARRRSHHHLSSPPPPLSSRLQQRGSQYSVHSQLHSMSELEVSHHYNRYAPPQAVSSQISPPYLYDHSSAGERERTVSNASSTGSFYSSQSPIAVPTSAILPPPHTFRQMSFAPSSVPLSASSTDCSSPHTPFSAALVQNPLTESPLPPTDTDDDGERPWDLVPYHVPWGSSYVGYKAGTLPGPEGKSLFLRSPTPVKNQRTSQACEKCRERKAKCSGARPSCARCMSRGLVCEYGPEIKKSDLDGTDDFVTTEQSDSPAGDSITADKSELEAEDVKPSTVREIVSPRPTRKLPERNARSRASVPNLRVKASAGAAAASKKVTSKGLGSPIFTRKLSPPTTTGAHRPKIRAPVPLNLSVRIPTIHHLSLSPQPHSSSASPPGTSETSSVSGIDFNPSSNGSSGDQEMTTPAPATALFFQDGGSTTPAEEGRPFFHGSSFDQGAPPSSASVSASSASVFPSPLACFETLEYPTDPFHSHSQSPLHHHSTLLQDHAVRYSASMPQLHMTYSMDDLDIPLVAFGEQQHAHQIDSGSCVSRRSVDSVSSVDAGDYTFTANTNYEHFHQDNQLSGFHERVSSVENLKQRITHSPVHEADSTAYMNDHHSPSSQSSQS